MKNLFSIPQKTAMGDDTRYSRAIRLPQYIPRGNKPKLCSLYNAGKYGKLIAEINASGVSDDEKLFLRLAASRHIVFNYAEIADYYVNASEEMQELMERSALVILDIDDAIANGYVNLSKKMEQLVAEAKENKKGECK